MNEEGAYLMYVTDKRMSNDAVMRKKDEQGEA